MPTSYTNKNLTGDVKTLKDFANVCLHGWCSHLYDHNIGDSYIPREPIDNSIQIAIKQRQLSNFNEKTDKEIERDAMMYFKNEIKSYNNQINYKLHKKNKLEKILKQAKAFVPPSEAYIEFKNFMIRQIADTIYHDCDISLTKKCIKSLNNQISKFNITKYKKSVILDIKNDIDRLKQNQETDINTCNQINNWVSVLLKSIK